MDFCFQNFSVCLDNIVGEKPHWIIVLIIGTFIGLSIKKASELSQYFFRHFKKNRISGHWFHYYSNYKDQEIMFSEEELSISPGMKTPLSFVTFHDNPQHSKYSGIIKFEKNFVILVSSADRDEENIYQRFLLPPSGNDDLLIGLTLAHDYNGRASVNPSILSRKKLNQDMFSKLINQRIFSDTQNKIMNLK